MKFTADEVIKNKFLESFFIGVMTDYCEAHNVDFIDTFKLRADGPREFDCHLTINGVELDPKLYIKRLFDMYEQYVNQAAKELLEEKLSKLDKYVDKVHQHIKYEAIIHFGYTDEDGQFFPPRD